MTEKRQCRRIPFQAQVSIRPRAEETRYELIDISVKGMLVRSTTPDTFSLGDQVEIRITPSKSLSLFFRGELVHREEDRLGVTFTDVDIETITHLRRLFELNTGQAEKTLKELFAWQR